MSIIGRAIDRAMGRRLPGLPIEEFWTRSSDGSLIYGSLMGKQSEEVIIVAHPAVVGSSHDSVLALAEVLATRFSVLTFDFRGHGRSTGRCSLGFEDVSRDLEAVARFAVDLGFMRIGVTGFSLGAAAAVLLEARDPRFDTMVLIGCPPRIPDISPWDRHPRIAKWGLKLLGADFDIDTSGVLTIQPIERIGLLPDIPKFVIFGESEVFPADDISDFIKGMPGPGRSLTIPDAWHGQLGGREPDILQWFDETLPWCPF